MEELNKELPNIAVGNINKGMSILRRQLLEAAYSIFEKFLCHVLRVFLYTFPQILKDMDKSITYREVVDSKENNSVFTYIVEKEIEHFGHRSLKEKKDYLAKRLHLNDDTIWNSEGNEMWVDIDKKRQAIVHKEETPDMSDDYLLSAINYFQRAMIKISLLSQVEHGVPFAWAGLHEYIKKQETPKL
jgi:hypothetical protein